MDYGFPFWTHSLNFFGDTYFPTSFFPFFLCCFYFHCNDFKIPREGNNVALSVIYFSFCNQMAWISEAYVMHPFSWCSFEYYGCNCQSLTRSFALRNNYIHLNIKRCPKVFPYVCFSIILIWKYDLLVSEECLFANQQKGAAMVILAVSPLV